MRVGDIKQGDLLCLQPDFSLLYQNHSHWKLQVTKKSTNYG